VWLMACAIQPSVTPCLGVIVNDLPSLSLTMILDVIMLDYPVQVRPMPGMWVQSVPVTAIPWGRMKTEQRNLVIRSIRKHD
jgi:hypothetical protein